MAPSGAGIIEIEDWKANQKLKNMRDALGPIYYRTLVK